MNSCSIKTYFPQKILKGAGLKGSPFLPSWVYTVTIVIENNSESFKICSLNSTFSNGFTYLRNLKINGPDEDILDFINFVEPKSSVGNDNLILFANNFKLSPLSKNIISFDVAVNDKYTVNSEENTGTKIPHKTSMLICSYLLNDSNICGDSISTTVMDYMINITSEHPETEINSENKFYIDLCAGQYDSIRKVYLKCSLNSSLSYLYDSCNLEPYSIYENANRTILKWTFDMINPSECKKIGFKVKLNDSHKGGNATEKNEKLSTGINSNGANNSTYTQCPDTSKINIIVI